MGINEALLKTNFSDPDFCKALGKGKESTRPGSFWNRQRFQDINRHAGGVMTQALKHPLLKYRGYGVSLGADFGQPFGSRARSTGIVALR